MGLGLGLAPSKRRRSGAAAAVTPAYTDSTIDLNFAANSYWLGTTQKTLAQLVTGAGAPTASGLAIADGDDVSVPLTGGWLGATDGTVYIEATIAYVNATFPRLFEFSDGTDSERFGVRLDTTDNITAYTTNGGSDTERTATYSTTIKACFGYEPGLLVFVANGGSIGTINASRATITVCQLGNRSTTKNRALNGNVKRFFVLPTRISGAAMQALTT